MKVKSNPQKVDSVYPESENLEHDIEDERDFITDENLSKYISAGEMYEVVANLCQEYAQDKMMEEMDGLEWHTIHEFDCNQAPYRKPIRVLMNMNENKTISNKDVLIIMTGRGKVRGGEMNFARKLLLY